MPEPTQLAFSHTEVVTALLKAQGIHEGIWGLYLKFGIKGMNIGASDDDLVPCAIVPVLNIGLQQFDKPSNIAVDAAKVNPKAPQLKPIGGGRTPVTTAGRKSK